MTTLEKIQNIASQNGWVLEKIYKTPFRCFVELLSLKSANIVMVSLNSRYVDAHSIDMKLVEMNDRNADAKIDEYYQPVAVSQIFPKEEQLEKGYTRLRVQRKTIEHLTKQYKRLSRCLTSTGYNLALLSSPYALFDDEHVFESNLQQYSYRMALIISGRVFVERYNSIDAEISSILNGIHQRLDTLVDSHTCSFDKVISSTTNESCQAIQGNKLKYAEFIEKYQSLLQTSRESELMKTQELRAIAQMADGTIPLTQDLRLSHQKNRVEKELSTIREAKRAIIETLSQLKTEYDSTSLALDSLVFENLVMLDTIVENLKKLQTIQQSIS